MKGFIRWHSELCKPLVLRHPLVFTDAKYGGAMTEQDLMALWSMPYYPHVPFIMERLNKAFFDNTERVWFYDAIDIFEEPPSDSSGLCEGLIVDSSGCSCLITDSSGLSYARSDIGSKEIRIVTPDLIRNHCEQNPVRLGADP